LLLISYDNNLGAPKLGLTSACLDAFFGILGAREESLKELIINGHEDYRSESLPVGPFSEKFVDGFWEEKLD